MANKSVRIQTNAGSTDKYVTVKLENDVDFYEVLSLKISQKDVYGSFNSDYGVIVGRVIANGGVGIPNAKLSVFIPISDDDKNNAEIFSVYPYSSPRDKDLNGVRYNLLPRVAVNNPFIIEGDYAPKVPIGTFPTKAELTTNDTFVEVYEKYYKFTTVTNNSGDYMFFGVPIGIQIVHMSVDITDIGKYSMTPGTMITNLGYSPQLFTDNNTKVKFSTDLETLPNVELQEIAVNVRPFWGDETNFEIGITRQDFKIRALLITTFTLFGSAFTDGEGATWGYGDFNSSSSSLNRMTNDANNNISIASKRNGLISEEIAFLPITISDADIISGNFNPDTDYKILEKKLYNRYVDNGVFVYEIPCNRKKIITNDQGDEEDIDNNDPRGVFTKFSGFIVFTYARSDSNNIGLSINASPGDFNGFSNNQQRMRLKFPQYGGYGYTPLSGNQAGRSFNSDDNSIDTINWKKQVYNFSASTFYSVAKYNGIRFVADNNANTNGSYSNLSGDPFQTAGLIYVGNDKNSQNDSFEYPSNSSSVKFGADWMNFNIYFPQITNYINANPKVTLLLLDNDNDSTFLRDNKQIIGGNISNTFYMGRSDLHLTNFVQVPKEDIINIIERTLDGSSKQGFRNGFDPPYTGANQLIGTDYKGIGSTKYFYKGLSSTNGGIVNGNADVFLYLRELNIV